MKVNSVLGYFWKLPVCAIAFFVGMMLGGIVIPLLGLPAPEIPQGTDSNTIAMWFLLGSIILAFVLSFVAQRLSVKAFWRWWILFMLIWGIGSVGMVLESMFFMETGAVSSLETSLVTILNFLLPSLFLAAALVVLFRPSGEQSTTSSVSVFFSNRTGKDWGWRFAAAIAAYPIVYIVFGLFVQPHISEYYAQGLYELTIPTWGQLIPLQLLRSILFLLICLPVLINWKGTRPGLWLGLGLSFFVLTAFMAVITAYWFPLELRVFHGLELLADGLVYVGLLVLFLIKGA